MTQKWITDVIGDLSDFARQNDMPLLAVQLEKADQVARFELENQRGGAAENSRAARSEEAHENNA